MYVIVQLPLALPAPLTYRLPDGMTAQVGCRVRVPLGLKATYVGVVVAVHDSEEQALTGTDGRQFTIKDVAQVLDATPVVNQQMMRLWRWVAQYYLCPLGDVLRAALPQDNRKGRMNNASLRSSHATQGVIHASEGTNAQLPGLSQQQLQALEDIRHSFEKKDICLLHGVTGSGKTEIYTHLIADTLAQGRQVLYLVPEIGLTTQLTERLQRVFGDRMAVYHSRLTPAARRDMWLAMADEAMAAQEGRGTEPCMGCAPLVLGTRSAVFLPWRDLGLVVIDEEHEPSYKQEEPAPRYHARSVALMLARWSGAKTLLGTATPSVESYNMALAGRYGLVTLTQRFKATLPQVEIIDTARLRFQKRMKGLLSPQLLADMRQTLEQGQQVMLFTTRRGYAAQMECPACGWVPRCQHCYTPLTVHRRGGALACHYCGRVYPVPPQCPACQGRALRHRGMGTEKVVEAVQEAFPEARVERMDLDTMQGVDDMQRVIDGMQNHHIDVLVGTQMLTKGLDFDGVTLVGVVSADGVLSQPDFRAHERGFNLLSQVAGRAGRRTTPGRVVIQTRQADLPLLQHVTQADYRAMFDMQIAERRMFNFPPFCRIVNVVVRHRSDAAAERAAADVAATLRRFIAALPPVAGGAAGAGAGIAGIGAAPVAGIELLGPATPLHPRIGGLSARTIMLKLSPAADGDALRACLLDIMATATQAQIFCDVDPQ